MKGRKPVAHQKLTGKHTMENLLNKNELKEAIKKLPIGTKYYKCAILTFTFEGIDFELYGFALTDNIDEAKAMYMKQLEDDEEATIGSSYMCIWPCEYVGEYINSKGVLSHSKGYRGKAIVNDFGKWKSIQDFLG